MYCIKDYRKSGGLVCLIIFLGCSSALGPSATTGEGFFFSGTTRLSYALDIPVAGSPPYPLVVYGHGSGPDTKNTFKTSARRLVEHGLAVFRFDKRGVGDSEREALEIQTVCTSADSPTSICLRATSWRPWIS